MRDQDNDPLIVELVRRLIGGDPVAAALIAEEAVSSTDPLLLTAAAFIAPQDPELLERAAAAAVSTKERQLVAIVSALRAGHHEVADALTQEHLADHPGSLLAAWIASTSTPIHRHWSRRSP